MMRCNTLSHFRTVLLVLMMAIGGIVLSSCGGSDDEGTSPPTPDPNGEEVMIMPDPDPDPRYPDLVASSFSVDDQNPSGGARLRLSASVVNRGGGESRRTTLRYYQSDNSAISSRDTEVDTSVVGSLDAGETSSESGRATAPTRAGTYYYGACVDSVPDESNTRNNCSRGVRVTVSPLYGAVAGGFGNSPCTAWAAAVVVDRDNESDALRDARNDCRSRGGANCFVRSFDTCGAVAYGWDTNFFGSVSLCGGPYFGYGSRESAAELSAVRACNDSRGWENCEVVANGGAQCNSTAR